MREAEKKSEIKSVARGAKVSYEGCLQSEARGLAKAKKVPTRKNNEKKFVSACVAQTLDKIFQNRRIKKTNYINFSNRIK